MLKARRLVSILSVLVLLLVALPATAAAHGKKNLIKVFFLNMGVQPQAQGKLHMIDNKAQTFFKIKVNHATPGDYDVLLDGAVVDTLTVDPNGHGALHYRERHRGRHAGAPLPFNPAGGQLEIAESGTTVLSATIPATPQESFERIHIVTELSNLGVVPGTAVADFKEHFGRMKFRVEVEGAAEGTYDLMVDGTKQAEILVDATGRGEVEFDSRPSTDDDDEGLDLLLTFDPRGKSIEVMQAGSGLFSAMFPTAPPL